PTEVIRATQEEKEQQIQAIESFKKRHKGHAVAMLKKLEETALNNGNIFEQLMETVQYCTLGEITNTLYRVGGQYRRNM
ncbi:MAG: methylmalonyl-CoA mutase, partial [Ferruginibacter sp.]|nr:methylmalonyl-CoA mutase [Ferruginibacter sp.]